jgi:serine/threonine protein kinase
MDSERWKQIKDAMEIALEQPAQNRAAVLREFCGADAELHAEVLSFLDYASIENGFLEEEKLAPEKFDESGAFTGRQIGKYKITGEIGAGGMGAVFRAQRADGEFAQTVAVKFLRQSFLSREAKRRFIQERQILAKLKHPFIAQLIDGGATEDGTPFLVMEFVEGTSITKYAEENALSLDEKLELFKNVCRAVSFAHQNFIVHRDLKPDNILISRDSTPKLLDFGIAKLVSETETNLTATRFQPFTPEYAAPEQIANQTISAASDVYSLGVILYELLTGAKPYCINSNDSLAQINSLFEKEPTKPSAVGSQQLNGSIKEIANNALTANPKSKIQNPKSLRGDLDTIVIKSLKRIPAERYASVENFAEDIRRYQTGLPISARPDTFFYRASKFVKRNRIATIAGVLIFAALAFGIGIALYQAKQAQTERTRAELRFAETRNIAKAVIFNYYDEINKLQGATKVRSMMISDALLYLDKLANDESAVKDAELRRELTEGYLRLGDVQGQPYGENLGDTDAAFASYTKALSIFENAQNSISDIADLKMMATVYQRMSQITIRRETSREKAVEYANKAVELREKIALLAPGTESKTAVAQGYHNLGWLIGTTGRIEESIPVLQKALSIIDELFRAEPANLELQKLQGRYNGRIAFHLSMWSQKESILGNDSKVRELNESALPYFQNAVESAKKMVAAEPGNKSNRRSVMVSESNYAEVLAELGRTDEALNYQNQALKYSQEQLDADSSNKEIKFEIAEDYLDLARTFVYRREKNKARENFEIGMKILDELIKSDPTNTEFPEFQFSNFTTLYGYALTRTGDYEDAIRSYRRALERSDEYANATADVKRARNFLVKKSLGDIYRFKSEKETGLKRQKDFQLSCDFYRESLNLLAPADLYYEKMLAYLNEKIAECAKTSGDS